MRMSGRTRRPNSRHADYVKSMTDKSGLNENDADITTTVLQYTMTFTLGACTKKFEKRGEHAIVKGLLQVHQMEVFYLLDNRKST